MLVEGAVLKRYRLSYWGQFLGSYDTAAETLAERKKHNELDSAVDRSREQGPVPIPGGREGGPG